MLLDAEDFVECGGTKFGGPVQARQEFGPTAQPVDTALVVSVDVSNSVDDARYRLQMEGIAKALEDLDSEDGRSRDRRRQTGADDLNLGELGHGGGSARSRR